MNLKDVLKKCSDEGHPMTAPGLYIAGKKNGFIIHADSDKNVYELDKEKFLIWLNKATEKIPENWMTLKEISEHFKISLAQVYLLIKDKKSELKKFGAGRGVTYVDPKAIERIIEQRKNNHKEQW